MTDKIKAFFQKKKANAKFMNAGKGYKLTDSTSTAASKSTKESEQRIQRMEPTEEAKVAGQAALARLAANKRNLTKFDTSYAAIQAQVKRELERERKSRQEAERKENAQSTEETKNVVENNPLLAVADVFFRCPYLSEEVLSRNEWKKKIKEFLYEQLKGEEAGLTACLIIQSCNTGREKIDTCVETLGKYVENIINNPDVEKYRKIRMCNRIFQEKVLPIEGALHFLKAAGFQEKKLLHNEKEEDFLVWDPDTCSLEDLTMLTEALKAAEPIPLELDRNLQVLLPNQAYERNELPLTFFTLTPEELKREQQLRTETIERNQMLRTKAMREKDEQREMRKYKFALIRIKFPDNIILQGTFSVHEKFQNVVEFVKENLAISERAFILRTPAGQTYADDCFDKTLRDLRLMPAVLLLFCDQSTEHENTTASTGYLKQEVLCFVETT